MLFVIEVENNTPIGLPYAYDNFLHTYPGVEYSEIHTVGYAPWIPTDIPSRPLKKQLVKCIETTPVWNEELQAYQQQWVWVDLEGDEYQQQLDILWEKARNRKNKALQELDIVEQDGGPFTEEQTIELDIYREKLNTILDNVTVPPEKWPISETVVHFMLNKENN